MTAVYTLRGEATLYERGDAKIIQIPACCTSYGWTTVPSRDLHEGAGSRRALLTVRVQKTALSYHRSGELTLELHLRRS